MISVVSQCVVEPEFEKASQQARVNLEACIEHDVFIAVFFGAEVCLHNMPLLEVNVCRVDFIAEGMGLLRRRVDHPDVVYCYLVPDFISPR